MYRQIQVGVLLLASASAIGCGGSERITILHLNDLHARLLPDDSGRGG